MYRKLGLSFVLSSFNILVICLLIIGSFFVDNTQSYALFAVAALSLINIVLLVRQLGHTHADYERAQLESERLTFVKAEIERYKRLKHDLNNHLVVIRELANLEKYDELKQYTDQLTARTHQTLIDTQTGSDAIDVLIYSKMQVAEAKSISFHISCKVDLRAVEHRHLTDLISILSNLLDNAIEASARIDVIGERMVSLRLYHDVLAYHIVVTNSFSPLYNLDPKRALATRYTTKDNAQMHGLGLSIVKRKVKRHAGSLTLNVFNGIFFQASVELPQHELNKKR